MGKTLRYGSFLLTTLLLVFYALPRLPLLAQSPTAVIFSLVWLGFSFMIMGANLYQLLGKSNEETVVMNPSQLQVVSTRETDKVVHKEKR